MINSDLVYLAGQLSKFVVGSEGNISKRTLEGFNIKASGESFSRLNINSFVNCDIAGNPLVNQTNKPSIETSIHAWIYKNSSYKYIAHTHPTNLLKILCSNYTERFAEQRLFPDQVVFNGAKSQVIPYAMPGKPLLTCLENMIRGNIPNLLLLKNHGLICCGESIREIVTMTEICDKSAEIFSSIIAMNSTSFLTEDNIKEINQSDDEAYRRNL